MQKITLRTAIDMLNRSEGRVFTVRFTKRTNGETRTMNCRLGVKKGITGKGRSFDPFSKGLVTVYDMQSKGYRMISCENVMELHIEGNKFKVV